MSINMMRHCGYAETMFIKHEKCGRHTHPAIYIKNGPHANKQAINCVYKSKARMNHGFKL